MRRFYFLLFSLALLPCLAQAQTTAITLQVTDSGSQQWLNGTWSATLVSPPGSNPFGPPFFQLGTSTTVPNQSQSGALSATGSATMTLSQNAFISPSGSGWSFNVCSLTTAINRCFTQIVPITSATTVTLTPPALIVNPGPTAQAYADAELQGAVVGSVYYNTSSNTQRVCNGPSPCTWGSSTAVNGAGTNQFGASFNVKSSGAIGDAKKTITAVTTNGSSTITDATNSPWLATDVGKKIYCLGVVGGTFFVALNTTIATISAFNSTSSISVSPTIGNANAGASSTCVWFTQKETTAFLSAGTAAAAALKSVISFLGPTLAYPSNVYCPPGGYVVDAPFFVQIASAGNSLGVGFLGSGKGSCIIYISPDVAVSNTSWIMNTTQNRNFTFADFSVDCSIENLSVAAPGFRLNTSGHFILRSIEIDGCGTTGDNNGLIQMLSSTNVIMDDMTINNVPLNSVEPFMVISSGALIHIRNMDTTNPGVVAMQIANSGSTASPNAGGPRSVFGSGVLIENSIFDEGGNPGCMSITASSVNMVGSACMEGTTTGISVDANSSLYLTDSLIAPFSGACSGGTRQALTIATTGVVIATGSDLEGCGTDGTGLSAAVKGTSAGTFVSAGGNTIRNCTGTVPCPLVTAAQFATRGFNGGIIPKSSETHTPNTCYITGTFAATSAATPPCAMKADQNYQLIQIEAASTTTTACTVAPVITISDGVQSATLTLTTAKSVWDSSVDASSGIGSVFATGNVITMSNTAGTCTTPPTNFNVTPILQSVLNP